MAEIKKDMNKFCPKELSKEDLEKVNGGLMGANEYSRDEYHETGLVTWFDKWFNHYDQCVFAASPKYACQYYGGWDFVEKFDKYVAYYQTHTLDEYEEYVRKELNCPNYKYNEGYDYD